MFRWSAVSLLGLASCIIISPTNPNPPTVTVPDECTEVEEAFFAELAVVQACETDDDCGQAIPNTSCGCTRDLVAAADADLTSLEALMATDCELALGSVCDCPEADGFVCDEGICNWNYVQQEPFIPACQSDEGDPFSILGASLDGNELVVDVEYSGGCTEHTFTLCWPDQAFQESSPVQAALELLHDDMGDACDAVLTEEVRLSLTPLEEAYAAQYPGTPGTVDIGIGSETLRYEF